mmetsp:Transcript_1353/g.2150  ORF Transcript_1353/g.2150 Transcript_1353/m.2150 type:complete len:339 (-) Transcript_1353:2137-3153(-)
MGCLMSCLQLCCCVGYWCFGMSLLCHKDKLPGIFLFMLWLSLTHYLYGLWVANDMSIDAFANLEHFLSEWPVLQTVLSNFSWKAQFYGSFTAILSAALLGQNSSRFDLESLYLTLATLNIWVMASSMGYSYQVSGAEFFFVMVSFPLLSGVLCAIFNLGSSGHRINSGSNQWVCFLNFVWGVLVTTLRLYPKLDFLGLLVTCFYYFMRETAILVCLCVFAYWILSIMKSVVKNSYAFKARGSKEEQVQAFALQELSGVCKLLGMIVLLETFKLVSIEIIGDSPWLLTEGCFLLVCFVFSFPLYFPRCGFDSILSYINNFLVVYIQFSALGFVYTKLLT